MSNQGPAFRISAKRKKDASPDLPERVDIGAVFDGKYGYNVSLAKDYEDRPGVKEIVLTDGTTVSPADYWINMEAPRPREPNGSRRGRGRSDDIPF